MLKIFLYVVLCAIWYHLYDLKNMKNIPGGVLLLIKLQASGFTKSSIPPWVIFTFFKLCKWYQIAQSITYKYTWHIYWVIKFNNKKKWRKFMKWMTEKIWRSIICAILCKTGFGGKLESKKIGKFEVWMCLKRSRRPILGSF